jgi:hypothetical protein
MYLHLGLLNLLFEGNKTTRTQTPRNKPLANRLPEIESIGSKSIGNKQIGNKQIGNKQIGNRLIGSKSTGGKSTGSKPIGSRQIWSRRRGRQKTENKSPQR